MSKPIKTTPYVTKYEFAAIIGWRTSEIDKGSKVFIKDAEKHTDSYNIALEEFKNNLIPFILKRPINIQEDIYEEVKLSELYHPLKNNNK